jgi:hypothetical protein
MLMLEKTQDEGEPDEEAHLGVGDPESRQFPQIDAAQRRFPC